MSGNPKADTILTGFPAALGEAYGDRLERVVLYGSRARGDYRPDSDYVSPSSSKTPALSARRFAGWRVHQLKGDSAGKWSIRSAQLAADPLISGRVKSATSIWRTITDEPRNR
jgi:hypothetical protein